MTSRKRTGQFIGALLLIQIAVTQLAYFRWLMPLKGVGFLATAAGSAGQERAGILLVLVLGAITLATAIAIAPIVNARSTRMAILYVALATIGCATLAMESLALRTMLALSIEYTKAGAPTETLQSLGIIARATWYSAHFTNLLVAHVTVLVFFVILFRLALVPRLLAALGMVASAISSTAIATPLFGQPLNFNFILPLGVAEVALIGWLLVMGFADDGVAPAAGDRSGALVPA